MSAQACRPGSWPESLYCSTSGGASFEYSPRRGSSPICGDPGGICERWDPIGIPRKNPPRSRNPRTPLRLRRPARWVTYRTEMERDGLLVTRERPDCRPLKTQPHLCGGCDGSVWATTSIWRPMLTMNVIWRDGSPRCTPAGYPTSRYPMYRSCRGRAQQRCGPSRHPPCLCQDHATTLRHASPPATVAVAPQKPQLIR